MKKDERKFYKVIYKIYGKECIIGLLGFNIRDIGRDALPWVNYEHIISIEEVNCDYCAESYLYCKDCYKFKYCKSPVKGIIKESKNKWIK